MVRSKSFYPVVRILFTGDPLSGPDGSDPVTPRTIQANF